MTRLVVQYFIVLFVGVLAALGATCVGMGLWPDTSLNTSHATSVEFSGSGTISTDAHFSYNAYFSPAEIAAFERTPIGDIGGVTRPAGDGCNRCSWTFLRVSETDIQWIGVTSCTLLACSRLGLPVPFK